MQRICIFSIDDSFHKIDDEKIFLLSELKSIVDFVIIVSNISYENNELMKLNQISDEIYQNVAGYDANRWKYAIQKLYQDERIDNISELLLVNDSFFGPLFNLKHIIEEMNCKNIDFWGLTSHPTILKKKDICGCKLRNRYLQTYFLCFRENVINDKKFLSFWDNISEFKNFEDYEEYFEFFLTPYFEQFFSWDVYADTTEWESDIPGRYISFILFKEFDLICMKKLPILSKYAVTLKKEIVLNHNVGEQLINALNYIQNNTDYDINMIYSFLICRNNLYDLKQALGFNFVLPFSDFNSNINFDIIRKRRIAIFAHLFYLDLFEYAVSYLSQLDEFCDIYITTASDKGRQKLFELLKDRQNYHIELCQYRGREWASYLLIFKRYITDYDYCCFIHDKKSEQMFYPTVGESFCNNLWENSLKNLIYVQNVISIFENNKEIGVLTPPEVYHGTYFNTSINYWTICFEQTVMLLRNCNIRVPLDKNIPPVALGSVYWFKPKALKRLFEMDISEELFMPEPMPVDGTFSHVLERAVPYFAQSEGYYTGNIMTTDYASLNLANYQDILHGLLKRLKEDSNYDLITFERSLNKKLKNKKNKWRKKSEP